MRHGKKVNHLKRKKGHRRALLANMAISLITHKRITTTLAKAKALRVYVEPLITKARSGQTHDYRVCFSYLQNKEAIKELFEVVAPKVGARPGGYVRIIKLVNRRSDNAEMAIIELVDFNETMTSASNASGEATKKKKTRRKKSKKSTDAAAETTAEATPVADATDAIAETAAEAVDTVETAAEDVVDTAEEATTDEDENKDA